MRKLGIAIIVTGLLIVLMALCSVSQASHSDELMEAAKRGDLAQVKTLLDKGADVNAKDLRGMTALT